MMSWGRAGIGREDMGSRAVDSAAETGEAAFVSGQERRLALPMLDSFSSAWLLCGACVDRIETQKCNLINNYTYYG